MTNEYRAGQSPVQPSMQSCGAQGHGRLAPKTQSDAALLRVSFPVNGSPMSLNDQYIKYLALIPAKSSRSFCQAARISLSGLLALMASRVGWSRSNRFILSGSKSLG